MSDPSDVIIRIKAVITGRVQGVGYRANCARKALELGVAGAVANQPDRSVEAHFEGPASVIAAMIAWCWDGPRNAVVSDVKETAEPVQGETDFKIS